jgi:hypothetical protein
MEQQYPDYFKFIGISLAKHPISHIVTYQLYLLKAFLGELL